MPTGHELAGLAASIRMQERKSGDAAWCCRKTAILIPHCLVRMAMPAVFCSSPLALCNSHVSMSQAGDTLYTASMLPIMTFLEDSGPGVHDTTAAACSYGLYVLQIGEVSHGTIAVCLSALCECCWLQSLAVPFMFPSKVFCGPGKCPSRPLPHMHDWESFGDVAAWLCTSSSAGLRPSSAHCTGQAVVSLGRDFTKCG